MRFLATLMISVCTLLLAGCSPTFVHQVGVSRVFKTVPQQEQISLDGSPQSAFADKFLQVSAFESGGSLGLRLKNVSSRPIALLQEQIVTIDGDGGRHELLSAGSMMSAVVSVSKGGEPKEVFPLYRFSSKQAGSSQVSVLLPVMIEGIYHEYHLYLKVQAHPQ